MKRIAIIGGGIAGLAAGYELSRIERETEESFHVSLFETSSRLGGIVETVREGGFVIEGGPDGWVTEKPWARELAVELGLEEELIFSNDEERKTWILLGDELKAVPEGMRMMVPTDLDAIAASELFSEEAKQAFCEEPLRAEELRRGAPAHDESIADFVRRHFGDEVLEKVGAPLLSGVFGGDVRRLSVRAVMGPFVAMERESGSLVTALQARRSVASMPIFTSLRNGMGSLIDRMVAAIPQHWLHRSTTVTSLTRRDVGWQVNTADGSDVEASSCYDSVMIATPLHVARELVASSDAHAAALMEMEASSAVIVAFGFDEDFRLPLGFGLLVPQDERSKSLLMACTFTDQKYPSRVPPGGRMLRAFFGGAAAERLMRCGNDEIGSIARMELSRILGPLPEPRIRVVRRLPLSLPQYAVGHLERMAELDRRMAALGGLCLLGNGYRGVGLPDIIRDARAAARAQAVA